MQEIMTRAVGYTLLHSLWQGMLLAGLAGILMMLTKLSTSATRYKVLCSLLVIFIGVVGFTFYRQLVIALHTTASLHIPAFNSDQLQVYDGTIRTGTDFASFVQQGVSTASNYFNRYADILVLIWFFIFLFHFTNLLISMMNAERMRYYKGSRVPEEWNQKMEELCRRIQVSKPVC